jgi:hypothetical protein
MNLTRLITAVLLVAALTTAPALAGVHHKKKHINANGEIVFLDEDSSDEGQNDDQSNQGDDDDNSGDGQDGQKTVDAVLFGY